MLVTNASFSEVLGLLRVLRDERLGFDTETTGLSWSTVDLAIGVSVWSSTHGGWYFPFRHPTSNLTKSRQKGLIHELELHHLVAYNAKYDMHIMAKEGMRWPRRLEDAHLLSHLANENEESFKLKELCSKYFGPASTMESDALDALLLSRGLKKGQLNQLSAAEVAPYAVADAKLALQMSDFQWDRLKRWKLEEIGRQLEDYERLTFASEERGLLLDMNVVQALEDRADPALREELDSLRTYFGRDINPRSSKQVCEAFGIKSSADEILEVLQHPMAQSVRRARKWATMRSNYCEPYRRFVSPDGALRPNYNLAGTVAGRPSCHDPNLQAVAKSDNVYRVKDCFIARPGYTYVSADYSQAELRLGAHYTEDKSMLKILADGGDIHGATAKKIGKDRDSAKRINFGVVYGLGAKGLSEQLRISYGEAQILIRAWNRAFPRFKMTRNQIVKTATEYGYIRMWTGRVRRFALPNSPPHKAFSSLIQGGVAEVLRHSLCRLSNIGQDIHIMLQVYDQILFEVPTPILNSAIPEIRSIMENFPFKAKLKVDISAGPTWGSLEKVT